MIKFYVKGWLKFVLICNYV